MAQSLNKEELILNKQKIFESLQIAVANDKNPISRFFISRDKSKPKRISEKMYNANKQEFTSDKCFTHKELVETLIHDSDSRFTEKIKLQKNIEGHLNKVKNDFEAILDRLRQKLLSLIDFSDVTGNFFKNILDGSLKDPVELGIQLDKMCEYLASNHIFFDFYEDLKSVIDPILLEFANAINEINQHLVKLKEKNEEIRKMHGLDDGFIKKLKTKLHQSNILVNDVLNLEPMNLAKQGISVTEVEKLFDQTYNFFNIKQVVVAINFDKWIESGIAEKDCLEYFTSIAKSKIALAPWSQKILKIESEKMQNYIPQIFQSFSYFKAIAAIELDYRAGVNNLTDKEIEALTNSLKEAKMLKRFVVAFGGGKNQISDKGITLISTIFKEATGLQDLLIDFGAGNNKVGDKGVEIFAKNLGRLTMLTSLELYLGGGNNCISDKGLDYLSNSFKDLKQLKLLIIGLDGGSNQITDKGAEKLAGSLKNLVDLATFELYLGEGKNRITDKGVELLAISLKDKKNLQQLTLYFAKNNVTSKSEQVIQNLKKNAPTLEIKFII